jgi:hypothetical protein
MPADSGATSSVVEKRKLCGSTILRHSLGGSFRETMAAHHSAFRRSLAWSPLAGALDAARIRADLRGFAQVHADSRR